VSHPGAAEPSPGHGEHDHGEHDHGEHDHGEHDHGMHPPRPASEVELRARALEALLVTKGLVTTDAVDAVIAYYEHDVGPQNGAKVVARAWVDPAYRERLLSAGTAAIAELGFGGAEGDNMVVVANTPTVHNAVVCTLCSCYPWPVLGLPPAWYKSLPYRARMVAEPRAVLREFGLELPADVEIRVWDSSAEVRYLVLPMRPPGTEGWSQERLAGIVTRDCMIGTAVPGVVAAP
jgi:nitrile hydratase subunit alpha